MIPWHLSVASLQGLTMKLDDEYALTRTPAIFQRKSQMLGFCEHCAVQSSVLQSQYANFSLSFVRCTHMPYASLAAWLRSSVHDMEPEDGEGLMALGFEAWHVEKGH
jgi:hypothetical protein